MRTDRVPCRPAALPGSLFQRVVVSKGARGTEGRSVRKGLGPGGTSRPRAGAAARHERLEDGRRRDVRVGGHRGRGEPRGVVRRRGRVATLERDEETGRVSGAGASAQVAHVGDGTGAHRVTLATAQGATAAEAAREILHHVAWQPLKAEAADALEGDPIVVAHPSFPTA